MSSYPPTQRLFLLGAGFSKPADLPLAADLLSAARAVARGYFRADGFSHLESALDEYQEYLYDVAPDRPFDLEEFGAWLDWEHVLRMRGPDTFSELGNEAGLQLRWAVGKVLYDATPQDVPGLYLEFARRLTTSDTILTLNYDLLLERALDAVGLPYRRFPGRSLEAPDELVIHKLHGSLDWTIRRGRPHESQLNLQHLASGPGAEEEALERIAIIPDGTLSSYYSSGDSWWTSPPLLLPPSTAKPLSGSPLIPLWDGVGLFAYQRGGVSVIGCSLAPGDPYILQLIHHIATDYVAGRQDHAAPWQQRRMKVVDLRRGDSDRRAFLNRFRFFNGDHTDFLLNGLTVDSLERIFDDGTQS